MYQDNHNRELNNLLSNIWVINLDKSKDRFKKISSNLNSLGVKFNRFSAIDGKNLSQEEIINKTNIFGRTFLCNYGMIGCALSHKDLWIKLVNSKSKYFIILEDDVKLNKNSVKIIKKLEKIIDKKSIDWINLNCQGLGCAFTNTKFKINKYEFGKPFFPLSTSAYIITKSGANKLLKNIDKITYHVDIEIAIKNFYTNFNYYSCNIPIVESINVETTIGKKNKSVISEFLNLIGLSYYRWLINIPLITIDLFYEINTLIIFMIFLSMLNIFFLKNIILSWFIILEFFLLNINYFNSC
jgi:glycosyl transferase family 25